MDSAIRLPAFAHIDREAECLFKQITGDNDTTIYHSHSFYEIFLIVSGTVTHYINGKTDVLPEGTLVFMRPDDAHTYIYDTPESRNVTFVNLTFSKKTVELLFTYLSDTFNSQDLLSCELPPKATLSKFEKKRLLNQLKELNTVNSKDKNALKHRMRALMADIFVRYFSNDKNDVETDLPLWFSHLLSEMERYENFYAGLERMVELSGKSREHIARCFKKYLNISPTEYLSDLRINHATNLLLSTNTPVLDVCFDCGFQSISYFYKAFKKKHGISPTDYRKNLNLEDIDNKIHKQKGFED